MPKIRWGVLGAAKIAVEKVIPAMQGGAYSEVVAIASRNLAKATDAAQRLGIGRAHASYEALIADPDVDAIYNSRCPIICICRGRRRRPKPANMCSVKNP